LKLFKYGIFELRFSIVPFNIMASSPDWYFLKPGEQTHKGPFTSKDLQMLLNTKEITRDYLVWNSEMTDWRPIEKIESLSISSKIPEEE